MSMQEILCPDCQKKYSVDLCGKDGQRFRCGVCSCYFYVTPTLAAKVAELDTYTQTERKVVCPHCGVMIIHSLDDPMGCYVCRCGEVYHLRKLKHSVPEDGTQTQAAQPLADTIAVSFDMTDIAGKDTIVVSEDTVPLPEVSPSSPTEQFVKLGSRQRVKKVIRFDVDDETLSHMPTALETDFEFTVSDPSFSSQEKQPKSRGICDKLAALCRHRSK